MGLLLEPRYEKPGLRGFRPGPTQTGLCNQEDGYSFEVSDLGSREIVLSVYIAKTKALISFAVKDHLRGYREADLRRCFPYAKTRFSHDEARL